MLAPAMEDALASWDTRIATGPLNTHHRGDGGHTAAGARRQAATHLVRDLAGHRAATDVRVVHHGFLSRYRRFWSGVAA